MFVGWLPCKEVQFSSVQSDLFSSPIGARILKPFWGARPLLASQCGSLYPDPFSLPLLFDRKGPDHFLWSGDTVVPELSACGSEWWGKLVSPHRQEVTGGQLVAKSLVSSHFCVLSVFFNSLSPPVCFETGHGWKTDKCHVQF